MSKIFNGSIKLAATIQPTGNQPLDDRVVVASYTDLLDKKTFGTAVYAGMLVSISGTKNVYILKTTEYHLTDSASTVDASAWDLVGGDSDSVITVNKYSDALDAASEANIGKIVNVQNGSDSTYKYVEITKAEMDLVPNDQIAYDNDDVPESPGSDYAPYLVSNGKYYKLEEVDTYPAGLYIITGRNTVAKLGTSEASGDVNGAVTTLQGKVSNLETKVSANTISITTLQGLAITPEAATTSTIKNGHVALVKNSSNETYGAMYWDGDDEEPEVNNE